MAITTTTPTTKSVKVVAYVDWSAVIAGTVIALAITVLMAHLASALGYTYERFTTRETSSNEQLWHHFLILGIFTLWTQLMASSAGGYVAGCARRGWIGPNHEAEMRDGAHGVLTWAVSTVLVTMAAAMVGFGAALAPDAVEPTIRLSEVTAQRMGLVWGFSLVTFSLVSAVAAWWTGTLGGDHRDRSIDVSERISFRPLRK